MSCRRFLDAEWFLAQEKSAKPWSAKHRQHTGRGPALKRPAADEWERDPISLSRYDLATETWVLVYRVWLERTQPNATVVQGCTEQHVYRSDCDNQKRLPGCYSRTQSAIVFVRTAGKDKAVSIDDTSHNGHENAALDHRTSAAVGLRNMSARRSPSGLPGVMIVPFSPWCMRRAASPEIAQGIS